MDREQQLMIHLPLLRQDMPSEAAGNYSIIVKLTRTLSIVPAVLIFSYINTRVEAKENNHSEKVKVSIKEIFPWFIIMFLVMVGLKSVGIIR